VFRISTGLHTVWMPTDPLPPWSPTGVHVFVDRKKLTLKINEGFGSWRTPAVGASIQTVDSTGQRVTVTRILMTGFLAWALKKKTGEVTLIVVGTDGDSRTVSVKPKLAAEAMTWAAQFNAWSEAASARAAQATGEDG
jgi:hypothetical protein